jgi:hypothetical protein
VLSPRRLSEATAQTGELFEVLALGRPAAVARIYVTHRRTVRSGLELFEHPRDEAVQLVLTDLDALGDLR